MSAVEDGDDIVCNRHKLWTTHGQRRQQPRRAIA
jgi:hypothetical protein